MDSKTARMIISDYSCKDNPTPEDDFAYTEALRYLIDTENDDWLMVELGGYYYDRERFDLAERYYLRAYENGNSWAPKGLGFIYYYGRNGEKDFAKAYRFFSLSAEGGDIESAMKLADMVRDGYGVEKDQKKYASMIEELYERVKDARNLGAPFPEIAHRRAALLLEEGDAATAIPLLLEGKEFIAQRIRYNAFWGNFIVARRTVQLLYSALPFPEEDFDFFDLFHLFGKPHEVELTYRRHRFAFESFLDEGQMRVKAGEKLYRSAEDFLRNHLVYGKHVYIINYEGDYSLRLVR